MTDSYKLQHFLSILYLAKSKSINTLFLIILIVRCNDVLPPFNGSKKTRKDFAKCWQKFNHACAYFVQSNK